MKTCDDFLLSPQKELYNLLFYPDSALVDIARENPGEICFKCIAELFRRWFITRSAETEKFIDSFLSGGERCELKRNLESFCEAIPSRDKLTNELWHAETEFSKKCQTADGTACFSYVTKLMDSFPCT